MEKALSHGLLFFSLLFWVQLLNAQEVIFLENPSFEDNPRYASVPGGWRNCAFNNESPPDVHPVENGDFKVIQKPKDGDTYLGLVVRENATAESIGQQLSDTLQAGQCYSFSLQLCRSDIFISAGRLSREMTNYNTPVMLKIWGGISPCGKRSLLATSPPIEHLDWKKYTFQFQPEVPLSWISFEAYFVLGTEVAYNGNILLDNASPILPLHCKSLEPLVDVNQIQIPEYTYQKVNAPKSNFSDAFFSTQGGGGFWVELRVLKSESELEGLILENCSRTGFSFGSTEFDDPQAIGLKEIAVNVLKFKDHILVVGMPALDKKLTKKRDKNLRRAFREIGLPPRQYRIELLAPFEQGQGWLCGQKEIWLKLEKLDKEN